MIHTDPSFLAKCIALDNTFQSAKKATVVDKEKTRTKLMKGGILNVLNETGEIIGWVSVILLFRVSCDVENG